MFKHSRLTAGAAWLPLALLMAAGCKQGPSPEAQARMDSLSQASADKERLMQEVAENTRLVSEISKELAAVAVPAEGLKAGAAESPFRASRDTMVAKIRYITTRVRDLEPKLQQSEQRVRELSTLSDSLKDALASTIQNLQSVIDNQKETIASLNDHVVDRVGLSGHVVDRVLQRHVLGRQFLHLVVEGRDRLFLIVDHALQVLNRRGESVLQAVGERGELAHPLLALLQLRLEVSHPGRDVADLRDHRVARGP